MNNLTDEPVDACERAWEHLSSCFLNAASVLMKQDLHKDAVFSCTKALEFKTTAKGHFRRAQVNCTTLGLESQHATVHLWKHIEWYGILCAPA